MINKTFFLIPGFKTQITSSEYGWLISALKDRGFHVVKTPVAWDYKTITENAIEFVTFFNKHKGEENYILGFSYGAVLAFITSGILKPKKLFLCSLSPTFSEDLDEKNLTYIRYIGRKRFNDFKKYSARKIAKDLHTPAILFFGEKEAREYPQLQKRAIETVELSASSQLIPVKDAPHQINYPTYIKAILKAI